MIDDLSQLAKEFISGEWSYDAEEQLLKRTFASNKQLVELNLIDADGYLSKELKNAILQALGEGITANAVGPFEDKDLFSGDVIEDITYYNIELHHVTETLLITLKQIPNIIIKTTKIES
jgi:hypothetical protein